jgi:hypothetical protein
LALIGTTEVVPFQNIAIFDGVRCAGEDVEGREGGGRCGQAGGFEDGIEFAGADYGVDFWNALADFVAVALDKAAGDDEFFCRAGGLVAGHF